jgi:hypothetical protein
MSNKDSEAQALPTKDLFDRYVTLRVSSRWAAFYLGGVLPNHRGQEVGIQVYGFWQPWLYTMFAMFKIYVLWHVLADTWSYCRVSFKYGRPPWRLSQILKG